MAKKTADIRVVSKYRNELHAKTISVFGLEHPTQEASLAFALIERWGMVACAADGESSDGRQKLRLMNPTELVDRAFSVAALTFERARDNGLMIDLPDLNEVNKDVDEVEEAREQLRHAKEKA